MQALEWLLLASVMATCVSLPSCQDLDTDQHPLIAKARVTRATRQRQPSFLFLLGQFFGQTISDTGSAARNISKIFNDQFTTTTPSPDVSKSINDTLEREMVTEDSTNSTTEAPPKPITREQLFRILGNNFRGLQRLFNTEWQAAVDQSSTNVANFRKELKEAVRPFLLPNRNTTNNQT